MGDFLMSFFLSGRSTRAFYREAYKRARARYQYKRSIERLAEKGFVACDGDAVRLTREGRQLIEILKSRDLPTKDWDHRWHVVMYDIPVSVNPFRFQMRRILIRAGFRKLQHSVWIHPYTCKELEIFLTNNPRLHAFVRYLESLPFAGMETIADWKKLGVS
jgi:DNA-binding transcriptional regulator PaaX